MPLEADLERLRLDSPHRPVSRLETLPQELRHEILGYLLHASAVRNTRPRRTGRLAPTGTDKILFFDWQVQVLRVSRTFYHDGKHVLYQENKWVKLQGQLLVDMASELPLITVNSAFENNAKPLMEITLKVAPFVMHSPFRMTSYMLPVDEITNLCNYLRVVRYSTNIVITYNIFIPTKVVKSIQRRLLQPFAVLREDSVVQIVAIRGEVRESLAQSRGLYDADYWLGAGPSARHSQLHPGFVARG